MSYKSVTHYRHTVHRYLDAIWGASSAKKKARTSMYNWLSIQMNIPEEKCHVSMFNRDQCKKAIRILRPRYITLFGKDLEYKKKEKDTMQVLRITGQESFETAHILPGYNDEYGSLYSHSYRIRATVEGPVINDYGMIMEYKDLKEALRSIVPNHQFVYCKTDVISCEIAKILHKYDVPYLELPFMVTSENMARYLKVKLETYIRDVLEYKDIKVIKIEIIGAEDGYSAEIIEKGDK